MPGTRITGGPVNEFKVHVDLTKEQVKDSPEFDRHRQTEDPGYHAQISAYYMAFRVM